MKMPAVVDPFINEVRRHIRQPQTEEIIHLGAEDRQRYTCRKTHNHRVRHELNDRSQMRHTHHNQQYTRHDGGYCQPRQTVFLNNAVDNHDERSGRSANLHFAAA